MIRQVIEVIPTISSGAAYTSGDALGDLQTLTGAGESTGRCTVLESVVVIDKSTSKAPMTLLFFNSQPTIASADNAAFDLADANADKCVGHISIAAADYLQSASNCVACKNAGELVLKTGTDGKLWCIAVVTGTPTYGSTSDLKFRLTFTQE